MNHQTMFNNIRKDYIEVKKMRDKSGKNTEHQTLNYLFFGQQNIISKRINIFHYIYRILKIHYYLCTVNKKIKITTSIGNVIFQSAFSFLTIFLTIFLSPFCPHQEFFSTYTTDYQYNTIVIIFSASVNS